LVSLLDDSIAACRRATDRSGEATGLLVRGALHTQTGEPEKGADVLRAALQLARRMGARALRGKILSNLGSALHASRELEAADQIYTAGLACARAGRERGSLGRLLICRGNVLVALGKLASAAACFQEAQQIFVDHRDPVHLGMALLNLSQIHLVRGELQACEAVLASALHQVKASHNALSESYVRMQRAEVRSLQGRHEDARREAQRATTLLDGSGDTLARAMAWITRAQIALSGGDADAAIHCADAGLELLVDRELPSLEGRLWLVRAQVTGQVDEHERALRLSIQADDLETQALLHCMSSDPHRQSQARAIGERLGCGPSSRLGRALDRVGVRPGPETSAETRS
jgi:tetratricopeptide (TPR) repeat protein